MRLFLLSGREVARIFAASTLIGALCRKLRSVLLDFRLFLFGGIRIAVGHDKTVPEFDYARRIFIGELGIVRDHYNQPLACYLFDEIHYLNGRVGIERARRLVGEQYLRIVHKGAGNGNALHLSARKLVGALIQFVAEPHPAESLRRTLFALFGTYSRESQS